MKPKAKLGTAFRQLLRGSTLAALISALPLAAQADDSIKVAGYGGATWDAITRDYLVPLKAKTGLDVKLVTEPNLAKLKAMVEAGRCEYEVIELSGSEFDIAKNSGWLQKIDYSIVDPDNRMPAEAKDPYGFLFVTFSELVAYRADKFPNGGPQNMADFWDVKKYPGPRTMHEFRGPGLGVRAAGRWREEGGSLQGPGDRRRGRPRLQEARRDQALDRQVLERGRRAHPDAGKRRGRGRHRLERPHQEAAG